MTGLSGPVPVRFGFSPGWACCHCHHRRSTLAWCIQKIGSDGAVAMYPMFPPTQTWTAPWMASRPDVKVGNVVSASTAGTLEAIVARSTAVPGHGPTGLGALTAG